MNFCKTGIHVSVSSWKLWFVKIIQYINDQQKQIYLVLSENACVTRNQGLNQFLQMDNDTDLFAWHNTILCKCNLSLHIQVGNLCKKVDVVYEATDLKKNRCFLRFALPPCHFVVMTKQQKYQTKSRLFSNRYLESWSSCHQTLWGSCPAPKSSPLWWTLWKNWWKIHWMPGLQALMLNWYFV